MNYSVNEIFYSLKGEGLHTGRPMAFIRLAGCNLHCNFCDTDYSKKFEADEDSLLDSISHYPTKYCVITGGEPTLQDLAPLVRLLHEHRYKVHLETNGTQPTPLNLDWLAVSPKSFLTMLDPYSIIRANEVKFLAGAPGWQDYIKEICSKIPVYAKHKYIMPLAQPWPHRLGHKSFIDHNVKAAVEFCLQNSEFSFCLQVHKVLCIP